MSLIINSLKLEVYSNSSETRCKDTVTSIQEKMLLSCVLLFLLTSVSFYLNSEPQAVFRVYESPLH